MIARFARAANARHARCPASPRPALHARAHHRVQLERYTAAVQRGGQGGEQRAVAAERPKLRRIHGRAARPLFTMARALARRVSAASNLAPADAHRRMRRVRAAPARPLEERPPNWILLRSTWVACIAVRISVNSASAGASVPAPRDQCAPPYPPLPRRLCDSANSLQRTRG